MDQKVVDAAGAHVTTENGAPSLATTQSGRLDLFFKAVRDIDVPQLEALLELSWQECPVDTMKIIFQTRDARQGKGERTLFRQMMDWVRRRDPEFIRVNLPLIPLLGRWDDVLSVPGGVDYMAQQLLQDRENMLQSKPVSLCAKWAPSQNKSLDRRFHLVKRIIQRMGISPREYRQNYLVPLRRHLKLVEQQMCQGEWAAIRYAHVPSRAMQLYRKAFGRHDQPRFQEFLDQVKTGKQTIKAGVLMPHELIQAYNHTLDAADDQVLEEQWKALLSQYASVQTLSRTLVVSDVSGSMQGTPMDVSVALGIFIASLARGIFHNQLITFSATPEWTTLTETDSLRQKIIQVKQMDWGMNTDLQAVFQLILDKALSAETLPCEMPERIMIISDMEFDVASNSSLTNYQAIQQQYQAAGYRVPQIVFWNVRSSSLTRQVPVTANQANVSLLSGFSPSMLKALLNGETVTPWITLRGFLDVARYAAVVAPSSSSTPVAVEASDSGFQHELLEFEQGTRQMISALEKPNPAVRCSRKFVKKRKSRVC